MYQDVEAEVTNLRLYLRGRARRSIMRKTESVELWEIAVIAVAVVLWLMR